MRRTMNHGVMCHLAFRYKAWFIKILLCYWGNHHAIGDLEGFSWLDIRQWLGVGCFLQLQSTAFYIKSFRRAKSINQNRNTTKSHIRSVYNLPVPTHPSYTLYFRQWLEWSIVRAYCSNYFALQYLSTWLTFLQSYWHWTCGQCGLLRLGLRRTLCVWYFVR